MAEFVTSMVIRPLISMVKDKMSSYLLDQYREMEGMKEEREVLERKLPAILDIIEDAKEKAAYRAGVRAWLKALKKVSYEANDIFGEFKYEALRREAKKRGHHDMLGMDVVSLFPACKPIVLSKKLQKIVQDIEVLVAETNAFGFSHRQQAPSSKQLWQMDSVIIDSERDIVCRSRNEEKKKIAKILLDHANNVDLLVLPTVGPRHLQHLRYLDLSGNWLIKQLPEEISISYNLQILNLSGCHQLCQLPRDLKHMANLRHLYTEECKSLKSMPPDLGKLNSLNILTYFVTGASSGCSTIGELQNLDFGGRLMLSCLENVTEAQAKTASVGKKEKLRHLSLVWSSKCREEPVPDCHKKVLDALQPQDGLEMLKIVGYRSTCLPRWMQDLSLLQKRFTELHLVGFTMCEKFPHFSRLEALQILRLEDLDKLQRKFFQNVRPVVAQCLSGVDLEARGA